MGKKSRITGLIAVAALAAAVGILWPVVGSASPSRSATVLASSSYTDASGDAANGGPDVTTVDVSTDSSGKITFTATIGNVSALDDAQAVQAFFDTDKNASTGAPGGWDYQVGWIQGQSLLMKWDGSQWPTQTAGSFTASFKDGKATFSVGRADFGGVTSFNFIVTTTGDNGDSTADRAPDGSAVWTFPAGSGTQPPPPPPPPGSPPPPPPPPPSGTLTATKFAVGKAHAGGRLTVSMVVAVTSTGVRVKTAVACAAKLSGKTLPVKSKGSVFSGRAACTWSVPKNTKGKTIKGSIAAAYQGAKVSKAFSTRVLP